MLLDMKNIATLQKLGLTYYGAKAYAALVATGPTTATVISAEAEVPRTKIYEVLKRLAEEKWVTVEKGRPILYSPRYPREIVEERKALLYSDVDNLSNELAMTYDRLMEKESPKVWMIRGVDRITAKVEEMMGRARQSVMLHGTLYLPGEIEMLKGEIARVKKNGVSVRIITRGKLSLKDHEIDIVGAFLPVTADIRISGPPILKYLMIDDREMLMMFSRVDGNVVDLESVIAIWIPNASVTQYNVSNFNQSWETARPIGCIPAGVAGKNP